MKNLLKLTLAVLFLVSCKDSKESQIKEVILNEVTGNNVNIDEKYALLMEELKTKKLLTNEELLEAYPTKLGNLSLDSNEARITSSKTVKGSYGGDAIQMEILDAAGENVIGAIIPLKMLELNKVTSESNHTIRYSKIERSGILTFGTDRDEDTKADYQSEIRFFYDNRFYVTLQGKKMNVDKLWDAIQLDDLKHFKELNK